MHVMFVNKKKDVFNNFFKFIPDPYGVTTHTKKCTELLSENRRHVWNISVLVIELFFEVEYIT